MKQLKQQEKVQQNAVGIPRKGPLRVGAIREGFLKEFILCKFMQQTSTNHLLSPGSEDTAANNSKSLPSWSQYSSGKRWTANNISGRDECHV